MNNTTNINSVTHEEWSTDRIKELTMSKVRNSKVQSNNFTARNYRRKFAAVAAVAAITTLAFTTTALAATGIIDFNSMFQSIFGNEQATPYVVADDDIVGHAGEGDTIIQEIEGEITEHEIENELEVEVLSLFADHGIYLEMQFSGAIGGMLSDNITLINWDEEIGRYHPIGGGIVAERIDESTTLANIILHSWVEDMYRIRFNMIASGVEFVEMEPTDINVGEHIDMANPIVLPGRVVEITEIDLNVGVLNITYRESDLAVRGTDEFRVGVMKPSGEVIWDENFDFTSETRNGTINIGNADPNSLVFVWGGLRAEHVIRGNWDFTVTIDARPEQGRFMGMYDGMNTEVTITATTVNVFISGFADWDSMLELSNEIWEDESLVLYLADGTRVVPQHGASEGSTEQTASEPSIDLFLTYFMDFTHPEDVVRVTFRGVEIGVSS